MTNITEMIPDNMPEWMREAMDDGQLFNRVIKNAEQQEKRICLLADAIGEIAISTGIIERGVEMTGPQVLLIAHDCILSKRSPR